MSLNKKGQGLSLNVIIVAALALIVLVVLVAVFTGRIGVTTQGIDKAAQAELVKMKISYGQCKPTVTAESNFGTTYSKAENDDLKEEAKARFRDEVDRCDERSNDKDLCEGAGCEWKR